MLLAPRRPGAPVSGDVAPGLSDLGVMLPTTPLHVELFREAAYAALVMTSGNASDEPICRGNREALERLAGIADLFLLHDRDVVRRADDSVARTGPGGPAMVRRARGYVPEALPLPEPAPVPVLALGAFLQATACLATGGEAFCSQHVGDLDGEPARAFLAEAAAGLEEFLQARGELIVVDPHPDYPSTWLGETLARERGARLLAVQHHLAHVAAVLAEHGRFPGLGESAAGIALDGTGWGADGTAWGGEWIALDGALGWRRLAHLAALPLVGGEAAVREPWRVAAAGLALAGAADLLPLLPLGALVPPARLAAVAAMAAQPSWPRATGAGRLFEAAGALLGLAPVNGYEGEAAARLESLAVRGGERSRVGGRAPHGPAGAAEPGAARGSGAAGRGGRGSRAGGGRVPRDVLPSGRRADGAGGPSRRAGGSLGRWMPGEQDPAPRPGGGPGGRRVGAASPGAGAGGRRGDFLRPSGPRRGERGARRRAGAERRGVMCLADSDEADRAPRGAGRRRA